jgi:hypothetical protein
MLQGIKSKVSDSRGIGVFVNPEDAAFLVKFVVHSWFQDAQRCAPSLLALKVLS